jgi:hypothetical protein
MTFDQSNLSATHRHHVAFWLALTAAILGVKIALLAIDSLPLFFLGDSSVYLRSALGGGLPSDRSFTYGVFFIRPVLAVFGSLEAVVAAQSVLSAAIAVMAAVCLRVGFGTPLWVAAVAALLYAVEPLALILERLIMTETLTLFILAWFVLTGLCYIKRPRLSLLIVLAFLGTCIVSLRTFHIPVVWIATVAAMLLGLPRLKEQSGGSLRRFGWNVLLHALVAIGVTLGFHALYKSYLAYMTNESPAYNSADGFFLVASWAPVVTPDDFPSKEMAERVLPKLKFDLQDPNVRANQRFSEGGLVDVLVDDQGGNARRANRMAKKIARNAALRDPIGVIGLTWWTYAQSWDRGNILREVLSDQGQRELDRHMIDRFKAKYSEDLSNHHLQDTMAKRWHRAAIPWYGFLLLSPFLSLLLCIPRAYRMEALFISVIALSVIAVSMGFGSTVRFHHALGWLTCIQLGILLSYLSAAWPRERAGLPQGSVS